MWLEIKSRKLDTICNIEYTLLKKFKWYFEYTSVLNWKKIMLDFHANMK